MHTAATLLKANCIFIPYWWWAGIALLCLILVVATFRPQGYPTHSVWSALSDMEKANSDSPPPASAMDVLKPLSLGGNFPSSGAVAARAREQMQNAASGTPKEVKTDGGGMQRTETVQTVYEKDKDGERTFRRLVVEYN